MLVLSRKRNESIVINDGEVVVTVLEVRGDKVRLGIQAAQNIPVHRHEVWVAIQAESEEQPCPPS